MKNSVKYGIVIMLITICCVLVFVACGDNPGGTSGDNPQKTPSGTPGLLFTPINNRTAYSVSKGTASVDMIEIPPIYNNLPVTTIAEDGFLHSTMTGVIIPNSVTSIGDSAFYRCMRLMSVAIPDSVTSIGNDAFRHSGLTSVTIGNRVTSIGEMAFSECVGLTSVTIGNRVTSIGGGAFSYCLNLTGTLTIPSSVTSIGEVACFLRRGLTNVTIPDSVTSIGKSAFQGCNSLTSITIPFTGNNLNETTNTYFGYIFGANSYNGQNSYLPLSLKTVVITNSINFTAFWGCSGLTSITIGNSVTNINAYTFHNCSGLTSITVDSSNPNYTSQDGILYNKAKTEFVFIPQSISGSITIPNSVTSIGNDAFQYRDLTSVTIGNSVTSIGNRAFEGCIRLTSITIPNSVTSIGNRAFESCNSLNSVTLGGNITSFGDDAFLRGTSLTDNRLRQEYTSPGGGAGTYTYYSGRWGKV
jgi:hypothetical protein